MGNNDAPAMPTPNNAVPLLPDVAGLAGSMGFVFGRSTGLAFTSTLIGAEMGTLAPVLGMLGVDTD